MMHNLLKNTNHACSKPTVYKYMKELGIRSVMMRKKTTYKKGSQHQLFDNLLKRDFTSLKPNQKWCIDFTYLTLSTGEKRYNCSILDLYDRRIVASLNSKFIDSRLAMDTLSLALKEHRPKVGLILHSDQGSQFASQEFITYCKEHEIIQSMSRAGCPYDNAVMERFYNTFKNEYIHRYYFRNDDELNQGIQDYIFVWYNYIRPHSYNGGIPPSRARFRSQTHQ